MTVEAAIVAQKDNAAFESWVRTFTPWVTARVREWRGLHGVDPDDLEQSAWLGLIEALHTYCPARGAFAPWAQGVMRRRILDAVKSARRVKHRPLSEASDIVEADGHDRYADIAPDPGAVIAADDTLRHFTRLLIHALSPLELAVLRAMMHDLKGQALAQAIGMPAKAVDNAQQRVRHKAWALWIRMYESSKEAHTR